jgi:serine/threonine-protein kinase
MSTKLVAAFLDRVQRSGLVPEQKLSQLRQELEDQGVDLGNPQAVSAALVERGALTQWQVEKLLQGKHKGFFLGSYRLLRPLGKGGMGAVFLAQHEMMRRQCAIKVLPQTQIDKHSSVLERFYVEAQAVASLDHPNIVRAYDVSKEVKDNKEIHYLVMEFVEGQDAQATIQESGRLDYVKAAEIIRQTANGLAHAHENGLIHRDIKPANLLLDKKGVVKILDLGLARFHDDSGMASLTAAHNETVLGTADYLSPEQALNSHNVDQRTDIYSLGCTAYFLLTGHPPFPEGSVAQRLVAHQVKQPRPISEERPDAPPALTAIISKMMAKNPEERFQQASEIAAALAAWLVQHGGEDWRRQHSEITGDSSIMNLLPQHREPTRAMSSAMSETELELAPLDEESVESDARAAPAKSQGKGSSAIRARKSAAAVKQNASDDVDLTLADDEETLTPAGEVPPVATRPVPPSEMESARLSRLPDELPPLEAPEPLTAPDLLAELPAEDALASLDQVDLMGPSESGSSLGAIESHVRLTPARGPSSSSRLKVARREPEPKPKTLMESIQAIGLPILIGVGGGLLLLVVIIVLFMFSSGSEDVSQGPPAGLPPAVESPEAAPPSDVGAEPFVAPATGQAEPPAEPPVTLGTQSPQPITPASKAQDVPSVAAPQARDTSIGPQELGPSAPAESPGIGSATGDAPRLEPRTTAPVKSGGAAVTDQPTVTDQPAIAPAKPAPKAEEPAEASSPGPLRSKEELLAALTQFGVAVEFKFPGGDAKPHKQLVQIADELRLTLRNTLEQMVSVKTVGLRVVDDTSQAVMEVVITARLEQTLVFDASAKLKYQNGQDWIELWSKPESELVRFMPQAQSMQLRRLWTEKIRDYFQDFRTQRMNLSK